MVRYQIIQWQAVSYSVLQLQGSRQVHQPACTLSQKRRSQERATFCRRTIQRFLNAASRGVADTVAVPCAVKETFLSLNVLQPVETVGCPQCRSTRIVAPFVAVCGVGGECGSVHSQLERGRDVDCASSPVHRQGCAPIPSSHCQTPREIERKKKARRVSW